MTCTPLRIPIFHGANGSPVSYVDASVVPGLGNQLSVTPSRPQSAPPREGRGSATSRTSRLATAVATDAQTGSRVTPWLFTDFERRRAERQKGGGAFPSPPPVPRPGLPYAAPYPRRPGSPLPKDRRRRHSTSLPLPARATPPHSRRWQDDEKQASPNLFALSLFPPSWADEEVERGASYPLSFTTRGTRLGGPILGQSPRRSSFSASAPLSSTAGRPGSSSSALQLRPHPPPPTVSGLASRYEQRLSAMDERRHRRAVSELDARLVASMRLSMNATATERRTRRPDREQQQQQQRRRRSGAEILVQAESGADHEEERGYDALPAAASSDSSSGPACAPASSLEPLDEYVEATPSAVLLPPVVEADAEVEVEAGAEAGADANAGSETPCPSTPTPPAPLLHQDLIGARAFAPS